MIKIKLINLEREERVGKVRANLTGYILVMCMGQVSRCNLIYHKQGPMMDRDHRLNGVGHPEGF